MFIFLFLVWLSFPNSCLPTRKVYKSRPTIEIREVLPLESHVESFPERGWLVVRSGSNVTLECFGLQPVLWHYTEKTIYFKYQFYATPEISNKILTLQAPGEEAGSKLYLSSMTLRLDSIKDTRRVTCRYNDTDGWDLPVNETELSTPKVEEGPLGEVEAVLLMFVYDGINMLVPMSSDKIRHVATGLRTTLPCRPAHPLATVRFFNITSGKKELVACYSPPSKETLSSERLPTTTSAESKSRTFNLSEIEKSCKDFLTSATPMPLNFELSSGFDVPYVRSFMNGSFYCEATYNETTSTFNISYKYKDEKIPNIKLHTTRTDWLVGETLSLTCTGSIENQSKLKVVWNTSNDERKSDLLRFYYDSQNLKEITNSLTVKKLRAEDSGKFWCNVYDPKATNKGMVATGYIEITVHSKPFVKLNASSEMRNLSVSAKEETVQMLATVHACPFPKFSWLKDGTPLQQSLGRILIRDQKLIITNPNSSDAGVYTLEAKAKNVSDSLNFYLTVRTTPESRITSREEIHYLNSTYSLLCHIQGVPLPKVWWKWFPCYNFTTCLKTFDNWEIVPQQSGNLVAEVSNLTVVAKETGMYACFAENEEGMRMSSFKFIVSDVKDGIEIKKIPETKTLIDDKVTLVCWINNVIFDQNSVEWKFLDLSTESEIFRVKERNEIRLGRSRSTKHSTLHELSIDKASLMDNTTYICSARMIQLHEPLERHWNDSHPIGAERSVRYKLDIFSLEPPWFAASLAESISVVSEENVTLTCVARGRPRPIIVWFKNNQPIADLISTSGSSTKYWIRDDSEKLLLQSETNEMTLFVTSVTHADEGLYGCKVTNRAGSESSTTRLIVVDGNKHHKVKIIAILIAATLTAILVLTLAFFCVTCKRMTKLKMAADLKHLEKMLIHPEGRCALRYDPDVPLNEQTDILTYNAEEWELDIKRIEFGMLLGRGAFGQVYKARVYSSDTKAMVVAIKTVRDTGDVQQLKALISELKVLIHLGRHDNVLRVIGAVTSDIRRGNLFVVTEYCRYGNLKSFLLLYESKRKLARDESDSKAPQCTTDTKADLGCTCGHCECSATWNHCEEPQGVTNGEWKVNDRDAEEGGGGGGGDDSITFQLSHERDEDAATDGVGNATADEAGGRGTDDVIGVDKCEEICNENSMENRYNQQLQEMDILFKTNFQEDIKTNCDNGDDGEENEEEEEDVRAWEELTKRDLYDFARQIASGFEYLSLKKCMHRDLAARNVLVSSKRVMKICDFGLAKDCYKCLEYQKTTITPVPVKWMALESLTKNVYTLKSDVWSFGVLLWEIFSVGRNPYVGLDFDKNFVRKLENGLRLAKPLAADDNIYNLMMSCWAKEPEQRPTPSQIVEFISAIIEQRQMHNYPDNIPTLDAETRHDYKNETEAFPAISKICPDIPSYQNDDGSIPYIISLDGRSVSVATHSCNREVEGYKIPEKPYLAPKSVKEKRLTFTNPLYSLSTGDEADKSMPDSYGSIFSSVEDNDVFHDDDDYAGGKYKDHYAIDESDVILEENYVKGSTWTSVGRKIIPVRHCCSVERRTNSKMSPPSAAPVSMESGIYSIGSKNGFPSNAKNNRGTHDDNNDGDGDENLTSIAAIRRGFPSKHDKRIKSCSASTTATAH